MLRRSLGRYLHEALLRKYLYSAYIAFPLFILLFFGWRYYDGCVTVPLNRVELVSGRDEEEEDYLTEQRLKGPKSRWRRIWDAV